jgi:hypothetical protein
LFVALTLAALAGVAPRDTGAASGMVNVMQQVGGSLGLSILVTVFGTTTRNAAKHTVASSAVQRAHEIMAQGVGNAFVVAAISSGLALLLVLVGITSRRRQPELVTVASGR